MEYGESLHAVTNNQPTYSFLDSVSRMSDDERIKIIQDITMNPELYKDLHNDPLNVGCPHSWVQFPGYCHRREEKTQRSYCSRPGCKVIAEFGAFGDVTYNLISKNAYELLMFTLSVMDKQ